MTRPFRLGLTGSIGMGKTTTAAMFRNEGIPVWDADAAVHRLYEAGGAAAAAIAALCPAALHDGRVDRAVLKEWLAGTNDGLARLEEVVHPLIRADRERFLEAAVARGDRLVVLDIPLLFETRAEAELDAVLVVTADETVQRARVMARQGMTPELFAALMARQMPDADKRARATYVIKTVTPDLTRTEVRALIRQLAGAEDA
jgi:dephospho-CoA kinase